MFRLLNAKVGAVDKRSVRKLIDGNTMKEMLQSGASTEVSMGHTSRDSCNPCCGAGCSGVALVTLGMLLLVLGIILVGGTVLVVPATNLVVL